MGNLIILTLGLVHLISEIECDNFDVLIDAKATSMHRIDSLNLLIYCKCKQKSITRKKLSNNKKSVRPNR